MLSHKTTSHPFITLINCVLLMCSMLFKIPPGITSLRPHHQAPWWALLVHPF